MKTPQLVDAEDREGASSRVEPLLLTVDEVAASLRIGRTKAYELVASGDIPSLRIGRALRVSAEDLRDWVRAQSREGTR